MAVTIPGVPLQVDPLKVLHLVKEPVGDGGELVVAEVEGGGGGPELGGDVVDRELFVRAVGDVQGTDTRFGAGRHGWREQAKEKEEPQEIHLPP